MHMHQRKLARRSDTPPGRELLRIWGARAPALWPTPGPDWLPPPEQSPAQTLTRTGSEAAAESAQPKS
eukprot:12883963-Prorocentrum_lima.AAC.1